ncbi:hypothetical protein TNCV_470251 [Trichonephila clavipes]|nr:hypothetical protein TNCV_470251 [Trichonephila clavipes]
MKASSTFSPDEDDENIFFLVNLNSSLKKTHAPLLWYPRLMFSAPHYPIFLVECSQKGMQGLAPVVKLSLGKMSVDLFAGNSSSRHSSKVTSMLMSRFPPTSSYDEFQVAILGRSRYSVVTFMGTVSLVWN